MKKEKEVEVIENAVQLWEKISKTASFNDVEYDKALKQDIITYLNIDEKADFSEELKSVPVEELLNAIFVSFEPLSQMLDDLLGIFSKAGAMYGDRNLRISVDFGKLKKDLNDFREDVISLSESFKTITKIYFVEDVWRLRSLFEFDDNNYHIWNSVELIKNDNIREWLITYRDRDTLPDYFPQQPKICPEVDKRIAVIWSYLNKSYRIIKSVYNEEIGAKKSIREFLRKSRKHNNEEQEEHEDSAEQDLDEKLSILQNETDYYSCSMMINIVLFIEHVRDLDESVKISLIEDFIKKFDFVFSEFESELVSRVNAKIESLNSFLNLPYWEHRYEIYSAWVFTLIAKAFGYSNLQYHIIDGVLSFSFGGSHLATYFHGEPLEIWAECRSEAIKEFTSERRGRSNAIQPDYTVAYADAKIPENAVAVVECKQYKKSSTKNFSEAIIDYAENRPNAKIFLVNYGEVKNSVDKKVLTAGISEDRFETFGNVRPQSADNFVSALKACLYEPLKITLKWGSCPSDLDLMLEVTDSYKGCSEVISYQEMCGQSIPPYAVLDRDCTKGFGPEVITVFHTGRGLKYLIKVHKYSSENVIEGEVRLKVECNAFKKVFVMNKVFETWRVCEIDGRNLKELNVVE